MLAGVGLPSNARQHASLTCNTVHNALAILLSRMWLCSSTVTTQSHEVLLHISIDLTWLTFHTDGLSPCVPYSMVTVLARLLAYGSQSLSQLSQVSPD